PAYRHRSDDFAPFLPSYGRNARCQECRNWASEVRFSSIENRLGRPGGLQGTNIPRSPSHELNFRMADQSEMDRMQSWLVSTWGRPSGRQNSYRTGGGHLLGEGRPPFGAR